MLNRRNLIVSAAALLAAPSLVRAQEVVRQNVSSFIAQDWRDHFKSLDRVSVLCDTSSRALHYWSVGGRDYRIYPTSVPRTEELTRRGYTSVVRKKVGPDWTPTPSMRAENPTLPDYMPPGPDNPLGTHAMYLSWPAYLIHGTHDTRKIGRRSSSGCIGLYNDKIAELFQLVPIGAQVRLI
jgi:L,D-transpeptidase ErfK/SrfK